MKHLLIACVAALALALAGCSESIVSEESPPTEAATDALPSAQELTEAAGGIGGLCLAAVTPDGQGQPLGMDHEHRADIRGHLQTLTDAAAIDPEVQSTDGLTVRELLFDVIPILQLCDDGLTLEAQHAIERLP